MEQGDFSLYGIKESKEAMTMGNALAHLVMRHLKDGLQPISDVTAIIGELLSNDELKEIVKAGIDGIGQVDDEALDLDGYEGVELAEHSLGLAKTWLPQRPPAPPTG